QGPCAAPRIRRTVAARKRSLARRTGASGDGSDPALAPALAAHLAMIHYEQLWLFFAMAFVMGSALAGGRSRGLAAVAGIVAGGVCHVLMTALGISVLIKLIPGMFNALLLAGALYIAWIGISLMRSESSFGPRPDTRLRSRAATFRQGMLTSLLNPKAYLFMLAVFPQFLRPEYGLIWL